MSCIRTVNLTKYYKALFKSNAIKALDELNLNVKDNSIFGLLGPNGAGKTTLVKILLGITSLSSGEAYLLNSATSNYLVREKIGFLPENHRFPLHLTGEEILKLILRLNGKKAKSQQNKIDYLLKVVEMEKWRNVKLKKYSKGMMQRIGIAQALINDPTLCILDEPTDGVDPKGRKEIRDVILNLRDEGKSVFINSHLLSEIEMVCDEVAILNHGKLIKQGNVQDMLTSEKEFKIELESTPEINLLDSLSDYKQIIQQHNNHIVITTSEIALLNEIIDIIRKNRINIKSILPNQLSLEDYYISVIKD